VVLIDVRLMRYFVAVAEERSFTAAARRLHIAQPSLSNQIRQLERRLGAQLIDRRTHPLVLTEAGTQLLDGAYRTLVAVDDTLAATRAVAAGRAGVMRVGFVWGGLYDLLMPTLRTLRSRLPDAKFLVRQLRGVDQLAALRRGDAEVALYRPMQFEDLDEFEQLPLFEDRLIAVLPEGHPAGRTGTVRLTDLADEPFGAFHRDLMPLMYDRCAAACRAAGFEPRLINEFYDPLTLALTVASGGGVALTGEGMSTRYPGLVYLPVEPVVTIAQIAAVWRPGCTNPLLRPFLDTVAEQAAAGHPAAEAAAVAGP
jgi:DNA-binding transcriptional LysR family regulator